MADGPIHFTNVTKYSANIDHVTRFGREFSIIKVPYSFKLLLQELGTMNVQLRIITEDNIDQLENMSFSDNINKLMMSDKEAKDDILNIQVQNKVNIQKQNKLPDVVLKTPDDELEVDYTKLPDMDLSLIHI